MNIFDIRREQELYYILDPSVVLRSNRNKRIEDLHIIVIIYLYYEDMINRWKNYIEGLPSYVECIVISSNDAVIDILEEDSFFKDIRIIKKPNVGRDISALLITAKEYIQVSDYVCFVHDKKEHQNIDRNSETDFWVYNLWENTVGSCAYIEKVLDTFEKDKSLGILSVPEPIGYFYNTWVGKGWYGSFDATKKLVEKLNLNCELSFEKPPITIGTAMWFRPKALRKLLSYDWDYSDFDDSKLITGDYISYAIERVFPYVAQDAGYKTGTVMSTEYAKKLIIRSQSMMTMFTDTFEVLLGVTQGADCLQIFNRYEGMIAAASNVSRVYLYGAGRWGQICLKLLRLAGKTPKSFAVTKTSKEECVEDIPVVGIDSIKNAEDALFIVTVSDKSAIKEIIGILEEQKYKYFCFWE